MKVGTQTRIGVILPKSKYLQSVKLSSYNIRPKTLAGMDKGKIKITGDIVSPTGEDWHATFDKNTDGSN